MQFPCHHLASVDNPIYPKVGTSVSRPEVTSYKSSEFSNQLNKIYIFLIVQNSFPTSFCSFDRLELQWHLESKGNSGTELIWNKIISNNQ